MAKEKSKLDELESKIEKLNEQIETLIGVLAVQVDFNKVYAHEVMESKKLLIEHEVVINSLFSMLFRIIFNPDQDSARPN